MAVIRRFPHIQSKDIYLIGIVFTCQRWERERETRKNSTPNLDSLIIKYLCEVKCTKPNLKYKSELNLCTNNYKSQLKNFMVVESSIHDWYSSWRWALILKVLCFLFDRFVYDEAMGKFVRCSTTLIHDFFFLNHTVRINVESCCGQTKPYLPLLRDKQ